MIYLKGQYMAPRHYLWAWRGFYDGCVHCGPFLLSRVVISLVTWEPAACWGSAEHDGGLKGLTL